MHPFTYLRPTTVDEAVQSLRQATDGKFLAGGMSLIPILKQGLARPTHLIDVSAIEELRGIRLQGPELVIGAVTPHGEVACSPKVMSAIPALARLASSIGDPQVRNRGTLGGAVANNDPASDYSAAAVALGATIITDRRKIAADDFFPSMFETALQPDELVVAVSFPVPLVAGYAKLRRSASRYALVGVMVARTQGGVRVAVIGAGPNVFRHRPMEAALAKAFSARTLDGVRTSDEGLIDNMHGSAVYRAHLIDVFARRALEDASRGDGGRH